jgi:hypothetical protein
MKNQDLFSRTYGGSPARRPSSVAGGGRVPAVALRAHHANDVDAAATSSWLHEGGIHIVWTRQGPVLVVPV